MGEMYEMRQGMSKERGTSLEVLAVLTDKEYEMVLLINQHQMNRKSRRKCSFQKEVSNNMSNRFIQNFRLKGDTNREAITIFGRKFLTIGE